MIAALIAAASLACAGIVVDGRSCIPLPPLVTPCRAVRACAGKAACAITVTGPVARTEFTAGEAWGDWHQRLLDAPTGIVTAAVPRLRGPGLGRPPLTLFLASGRPTLVMTGLATDDLGWLADYRATGAHPDGLRRAPADIAARLCPAYASSRAQSRAK